jgi:hypothetical protein
MGVGFIQLIAIGNEEHIFNRSPNISFFKTYFRRHSNFFINNFEIDGKYTVNINDKITNKFDWIITKNGDMMEKTYIRLEFENHDFELFNKYENLYTTLNTNILNLYDAYYIKVNTFNYSSIKIIEIFKGNYYYNNELILEFLCTNIPNNNELFSLINKENGISLEEDSDGIFYNINENYNFYAFDVNKNSNIINNDMIMNYLIKNININEIFSIIIDISVINFSFHIKFTDGYQKYIDILNLIYKENITLLRKLRINENTIYFSISFNTNLYDKLLEIVFGTQDLFRIEFINNKIKSINITLMDNVFNKIKNILTKYDSSNIVLINVITGDKEGQIQLTAMKEYSFFGNISNEYFNDMLINEGTQIVNMVNLCNVTLSLDFLIKTLVTLACGEKVSIEEFLKIVNTKNFAINLRINEYVKTLSSFNNKILGLIMNPFEIILSNGAFYNILYTKSVNDKFNNNSLALPFTNRIGSYYASIIIDNYFYKNIVYSINYNYNNTCNDLAYLLSLVLIYIKLFSTKETSFLIYQNYQLNYIYNNNLFKFVTFEDASNIIESNIQASIVQQLIVRFQSDYITGSINLINNLINKKSNYIYQPNGKVNDFIYKNSLLTSIFPLSSSVYVYTNNVNNPCSTSSSLINDSLIFNISDIDYFKKLEANVRTGINNLFNNFKTNPNDTISIDFNYLSGSFSFEVLYDNIFGYYDGVSRIMSDLNYEKINDCFSETSTVDSIINLIYPEITSNLLDTIFLNIFTYTDNNLYNNSFSNYVYTKRDDNCENITTNLILSKNYLKFIFLPSSPLYRLTLFFMFLSYLSTDTSLLINEINQDLANLRDLTLAFILNYLKYFNNMIIEPYISPVLNKFNLEPLFNNDYLLSNNFLCYDSIDIFNNSRFKTRLLNQNSQNFVMFYYAFYFIVRKTNNINITETNIDSIISIVNNINYNFDDIILTLYRNIIRLNNQYFYNKNGIINLINNYFDKYNNNFDTINSIIIDIIGLNNLKDDTGLVNDEYYFNNYLTAYTIGSVFDESNRLNIREINIYYNYALTPTNDAYTYTFKSFNIKKNDNYLLSNNIITALNNFKSGMYNLFYDNKKINSQYFTNYIYQLTSYINQNINFLYVFMINEYNYDLCFSILQKYLDSFNNANNYNFSFITSNEYSIPYLPNNKYMVIYILFYFLYFINTCLKIEINIFNNNNLEESFNTFIIKKYTVNIYYNCISELINVFNTDTFIISFDYSTFYYSGNNNIGEYFDSIVNTSDNNNLEIMMINNVNSNDVSIYGNKVVYNTLINTSNILINKNYYSTNNTIGILGYFYKHISNQVTNLSSKINNLYITLYNSGLINQSQGINISSTVPLVKNFVNTKNTYYIISIETIKNIYNILYTSSNNILGKGNENSYINKLINNILNIIYLFYNNQNPNYFGTIYFKRTCLTKYSINNVFSNQENEYLLKLLKFNLDDINNETDLLIFYSKYINYLITYSLFFEKEMNRLIYVICNNYIINLNNGQNNYKEYLSKNSLYNIVKVFYYNNGIKVYKENTALYQNQDVFQLLNFDNLIDNLSYIQNKWVNEILLEISQDLSNINSYYKNYINFKNYILANNQNILDFKLKSGISVLEYFLDLTNYDEMGDLIFDYICLNQNFSPEYIYNGITEFLKKDEVNSYINIDTDLIKKKVIIYLFISYIILSNIYKLLIRELDLNKEIYLEYNMGNEIIIIKLADVFGISDNIELVKYAIYKIYNMDLIDNPIYQLTDNYKFNKEVNFIIDILSIIVSPTLIYNILIEKFICSYELFIGNDEILTNNYTFNTFSPTVSNLLNKINVVFNNDTANNNINKYDLTYFAINLYEIKLDSSIYDLENNSLNKSYTTSYFYQKKKINYTNTQIFDINVIFILLCDLLKVYNITFSNLNNQINIVLGNLRIGSTSINELFEVIKGYSSEFNISLNILPTNIANSRSEILLVRIGNIKYLTEITNIFDNLSLITPSDYDYSMNFINFGKLYINIFKKYYNYDYNFYNFNTNYYVIYESLYLYYTNIVSKTEAISNIKRYNSNVYKKLFIEIIYTYLANDYYNVKKNNIINFVYIPTFNKLINLYFQYNYEFRLNNYISNIENLKIQAEFQKKANFTSYETMISYLVYYYYYELFSSQVSLTTINYKSDILDYWSIFNNNLNINFNYINNSYNFIYKYEIVLKLLIFLINKEKNLKLNINSPLLQHISNTILNYFSNKYNIQYFINLKYVNTTNDQTMIKITYVFENTINKKELYDKLSLSIQELLYYNNSLSYNQNLVFVWEKYFKNYNIKYTQFTNDNYEIINYNLTSNELFCFIYNYINSQIFESKSLIDFALIIKDDIANLFSYNQSGNINYIQVNTIEEIIYSYTQENINANNNIITFTIRILQIILKQTWGIINYNGINNSVNSTLNTALLFNNYYFSYLNYVINNEISIQNNQYSLVTVNFNYDEFLKINIKLNILFKLLILIICFQFINYKVYDDIIFSILINAHNYVIYGQKTKTYNLTQSISTYFDYLNSNLLPNNKINNFFKDIQQNSIVESNKYNIPKFVNNDNNFDSFIPNILIKIINEIDLFEENGISAVMYYNIIINIYNNYTSEVKDYLNQNDKVMINIYDSLLNNIKNSLSIYKNIFGGQYKDNISLNSYSLNNVYNINNFKNNNNIITIFSIIYQQIDSGVINNNVLIILFYYNCYVSWLTNNANNTYNTTQFIEIIYNFANLINTNLLLFLNLNSSIEQKISSQLFFDKLNTILFSIYNNYEFINACKQFFETMITNRTIINDNILNNLIKTNLIFMNTNTNNLLINSEKNYYNFLLNNYDKITNDKIYIWKYLIGLVVDYNNSEIIKIIKSLDEYISPSNTQQEYIDYIMQINGGIINEYGIIELIDNIQLFFDDELIDKYDASMYKYYVDVLQNLNQYPNLANMLGLNNEINSNTDYIVPGLKPFLKVFKNKNFYIPLFFFFRKTANAIPLITCMYTNIQIVLNLKSQNIFKKSILTSNLTAISLKSFLNTNFILLEREERKMLCAKPIDNLIERYGKYVIVKDLTDLLLSSSDSDNELVVDYDFTLNNLFKEIFWTFDINTGDYSISINNNPDKKNINSIEYQNFYKTLDDYNISINDIILNNVIVIDGARRDGAVINQKSFDFKNVTKVLNFYRYNTRADLRKNIYAYSFAMEPEQFQPTGAINMSTLSTFTIRVHFDRKKLLEYYNVISTLFNINNIKVSLSMNSMEYNLVRYQSGLAGLLFVT